MDKETRRTFRRGCKTHKKKMIELDIQNDSEFEDGKFVFFTA